MLELTGFLGLTRISFFFAHTDLTDPTVLLCGWEISQMLLWVGGSCGFHLVFGLTRISQIPQYRFVGGKSHRCFCGWEISQMALWVWAPGGCTGLALTDLSFGPFGQIRPIGQIGRIGHF